MALGMTAFAQSMMLMPCKATNGKGGAFFSPRPAFLNVHNWCRAREPQNLLLCAGSSTKPLAITASPPQSGARGFSIPSLPLQKANSSRGTRLVPRASKYSPSRLNIYPPMVSKPKWWWRTLACIPYLIPLHATWTYAEYAFHLNHFIQEFEFFADSFNWYIASFPAWSLMAYAMALYLGVVRRRQYPHFLRYHVVNAILLDNVLQIVGIVCGWLPRAVFRGELGLRFWTAVAVAYLFTVIECIRSALAGAYADVPFLHDAACIQCDFLHM
ncbi:hypothetical protein HPP92_005018 [Vanilla planifolia]|uniref:Protein TIC 20 n=1 Tax=Vanilla planifolia TaxID=51239 RepID=A0A835RII1_VANPL|nr:hypothetical protein HPP92_005357 [Vanilla planifolia]KAG0494024.1 hypothetical protein HPP92_005018 [Vanilla planifolia]